MKKTFKELNQGEKFKFSTDSEVYLKLQKPVVEHALLGAMKKLQKTVGVEFVIANTKPYTAVAISSGSLIVVPSEAEVVLEELTEGMPLEKLEEELVKQALVVAGGNQTKAASLLGIQRDALIKRMKKFGLL